MEELRRQAQDLARAHKWADYLALVPELRRDTDFWNGLWAPLGHHIGDEDLDGWWQNFAAASTTGASWGAPSYIPFFQGEPRTSPVLLRDRTLAWPAFEPGEHLLTVAARTSYALPQAQQLRIRIA